ncbi:hypothetical protein ACFSKM_25830 [Ancylobacter dichloromethanicus]|uniref:Uncharacterized protein n=1 Tax=Ancylobacter dichloromethanicus TaxID=518825 RepID=A0A9W6J9L3_9HYPH|nr:hypothetical protein GCM10017643_24970 [Ancylobacter dichloromethanicus]
MKNLAHSASFHSCEKTAPSKPGIKHTLRNRRRTIAQTARDVALTMDFAFLLDPERKLLSIG